jgi:Dyp-type peroxidase family
MSKYLVAREAPILPAAKMIENDPSLPAAPTEPILAVENIQGNIIGFNKDHQTLIFLKVTDAGQCRKWLRALVPFIATAGEVLSFNRLFKQIRRRRGVDTHTVQATWLNVALSFNALQQLTDDPDQLRRESSSFPDYAGRARNANAFKAERFADAAFRQGMQSRAVEILGDPAKKSAEGNPKNWVFGGPKNEADVVVIIASDSQTELAAEVARIEETIYSGRTPAGEAAGSGIQVIYKQEGKTLPPPLTGHEHFGFLDGVSQPGLRGRLSEDPTDLLTPRQNPDNPDQGKPGQDVLWPGEFIFGYPRQNGKQKPGGGVSTDPGPISEAEPVWGKDGSFYVVRRLRQDVDGFHKFLESKAHDLGIGADLLGAKLVGRWTSGAPIMREPAHDEPHLGNDDCANNNFDFQDATGHIPPHENGTAEALCVDNTFPPSPGDKTGARCPFASHIRKAYPRDDVGTLSSDINEATTQTHRLLRRGIPFGDPFFASPDPTAKDSGDRGLVFAAYQTSIVNQFEFVTQNWVNNPEFKDKTKKGKLQSGHDFIIGQSNGPGGSRERRCRITVKAADGTDRDEVIAAPVDWVIPTGGGYFFAPSIDALCLLTGIDRHNGGKESDEYTENDYAGIMYVTVAPGTQAEKIYRSRAGIDPRERIQSGELVVGLPPSPQHDLVFRGGRTIPNLAFTNFFVGGTQAWQQSDVDNIDRALSAAMSDRRLNNVLAQYFRGAAIGSTFRPSRFLEVPPPQVVSRGDIEALLGQVNTHGLLADFDPSLTVFNFMLPSGTVLTTDNALSGARNRRRGSTQSTLQLGGKAGGRGRVQDEADSLHGLGGYHGSVLLGSTRFYYAVGAFSEQNDDGSKNGIVAFDEPWKNVVATFYHELCEVRTDPDVEQANQTGDGRVIGWTSRQGEEIGDFPIFEDRSLSHVFQEVGLADGSGTVPVQLIYSNAAHGPEGPIDDPH